MTGLDEGIWALSEIGYLLRQQEGEIHRARAFTRAAFELARQRPELAALRKANQLESIESVGAGIARVLAEVIDTGRSSYLERLRELMGQPAAGDEPPLRLAGYRGDLHSHTEWSDGRATLPEMALAARARGYRYLGVTDHSPRIAVVNGLNPERLRAQARQIEETEALLPGLALLRGIEVDILEDGRLDLDEETLSGLEVVIASPHVKLRTEKAAMTQRMLRAVEHPQVNVVGHPTGRRPGSRAGAEYDFEAVFGRCAELGVALEIDCDPARMDAGPELARLAAGLGCRFCLDSDAHAPDELLYVDMAAWMARRAGIPEDRILNWLELDDLRRALR
ncbi:MAG TPA: PHP domain-containing protein [Candidatus Acidoferrales bacterium]|nr:PHP domain-containing protein [Candidatus Acidoferrales bacterium]